MSPIGRAVLPLGPVSPDRPPLDPTAEHARSQLAQELAKAKFGAARPGPIDLAVQWLQNWFNSLFDRVGNSFIGGPGVIILIVVLVVIAAIVVAFFVFGLPRLNRRSAITGALFGTEDDRGADELRRAAERAAAAGDFATAIEEGFRAIARGLAERTIVTTFPGTTAHSFAVQAAGAFPDLGEELSAAADAFDAVRYLGVAGTEAAWVTVRSLETRLRATRPLLEAVEG